MNTPKEPDPRDAMFATADIERNLGRHAGNSSIIVLVIAAAKLVQQIGSVAILARLIGPEDYGIFAMTMPAVTVAMALSNFGLPQAIVQRKTITHAEVSALFWINLVFGLVSSLAMAALAGPAADYYNEPLVKPVFQVVSLSILFSVLTSQYLAIMRRRLHNKSAELLSFAGDVFGVIVAVVAALIGFSYWALVAQQIAMPAATALFMVLWTRWLPSPPRRQSFSGASEAVRFGGYVAGSNILIRLTEYVGTVIAGRLFDPTATGLFYRVRNLASLPPKKVMIPLSGVFVPTMSRLQDQPEALQAMFQRLISRSSLILLPQAVLVAAGSAPIVSVLLGPNWAGAAPLLLWMSIFTFREAGSTGLQYALVACGKSRALFLYGIIRILLVGTVMVVAARYGLTAMTAAYTLCELFVTLPLMVLVADRVTPIKAWVFARACLGDMIMAGALALGLILFVNPLFAHHPGLVQLAVLAAIVFVAYAVRVGLSPSLRRDVLRIVEKLADKVRRKRGRKG